MISFDFMIRADGAGIARLSTKETLRFEDLNAVVLTSDGGVLPATLSLLNQGEEAKLIMAFPLFTSANATLLLLPSDVHKGMLDAMNAEELERLRAEALWNKKISRGQLKWSSRWNYRSKHDEAMFIRDINHFHAPQNVMVEASVVYQANSTEAAAHYVMKGFTSFADEINDVVFSVRDGNGIFCDIPMFISEPGSTLGEHGTRKTRSFTVRLPLNNETYVICVEAKNSNSKGFLCFDPISKGRLLSAHDPNFYKIAWDGPYQRWFLKQTEERSRTTLSGPVKFSIVVPLYCTPLPYLNDMIASVVGQTYQNWELVLVNASPEDTKLKAALSDWRAREERLNTVELGQNRGIAANTNAGTEVASGDFICFLDHDDLLAPDALASYASALEADPTLRVIYSDEDLYLDDGTHFNPHFKSDFNIDLLRCHNYVTHFLAVEASLAKELVLDPAYDGAQDYDFVLRLSERVDSFFHVRKVLYHWRAHERSTAASADNKSYADEAGRRALQAHLDRCGLTGTAELTELPCRYRAHYEVQGEPLVSIIIPSKDNIEVLERCIESLFEKTTYQHFEVIIVENNSTDPATFAYYHSLELNPRFADRIEVITWDAEFNYAAINNFAAARAHGEFLLLLNNDIEVIAPDWLESMLSVAQRADVGAVGAKLLYPDNTVQHAGIAMLKCFTHSEFGEPIHIFNSIERDDQGYWGRAVLRQNVSAVTGACLLTKKALYDQLGGLNEQFCVAFNDVDYCLRLREAGKLIVLDPEALLYHYESITRGSDDVSSDPANYARFLHEQGLLRSRWSEYFALGDPYFTPYCTQPW